MPHPVLLLRNENTPPSTTQKTIEISKVFLWGQKACAEQKGKRHFVICGEQIRKLQDNLQKLLFLAK